jgi:hypothetical protein
MKPEISLPVIAQVSATLFGLVLVSMIFLFNAISRRFDHSSLEFFRYSTNWIMVALGMVFYTTVASLELLTETKNPRATLYSIFAVWAVVIMLAMIGIIKKHHSIFAISKEMKRAATISLVLSIGLFLVFLATNLNGFIVAGKSIVKLRQEVAFSLAATIGLSTAIIVLIILLGVMGPMMSATAEASRNSSEQI